MMKHCKYGNKWKTEMEMEKNRYVCWHFLEILAGCFDSATNSFCRRLLSPVTVTKHEVVKPVLVKHSDKERQAEDHRNQKMNAQKEEKINKEVITLLFVLQVQLRKRREFVAMALGHVIYVSTAWGTEPWNKSRTTAVWDSGKISDDNIKRKLIVLWWQLVQSGKKLQK